MTWFVTQLYGYHLIKDNRTIMVNTEKDLKSLLDNKVTKDCFAVSSWYEDTCEISCQWDAPKLEILILNAYFWRRLSFDGLKELKVLAITNESSHVLRRPLIHSLTNFHSIQSLTNLRTLCLRGWDLSDISFILSLKKLEVLDLQHCSVKEVPEGIEKLNKLKLLDLKGSKVVENYNSIAIARCPQLQELYVTGNRSNPPQRFVHDLASTNLQRYELLLGSDFIRFARRDYSSMNILGIYDFEVSTVVGSKNLLQEVEQVEFNCLRGGCNNVMPNVTNWVVT